MTIEEKAKEYVERQILWMKENFFSKEEVEKWNSQIQ